MGVFLMVTVWSSSAVDEGICDVYSGVMKKEKKKKKLLTSFLFYSNESNECVPITHLFSITEDHILL